jgi:hypothetical protein
MFGWLSLYTHEAYARDMCQEDSRHGIQGTYGKAWLRGEGTGVRDVHTNKGASTAIWKII